MTERLDLRLLGQFRAEIDGRAVPREDWRQGRGASLVKLLALSPRHSLTREQLIEELWPGVAPDAGGASVRKAVHYARRALGGERSIAVGGGVIELWPNGTVSTDVALRGGKRESLLDRRPRGLLPGGRAVCGRAAT